MNVQSETEDRARRDLAELRTRRAAVLEMGGAEAVARHRANGKLTVRERIDVLADAGSFREFNSLAGVGRYEDDQLVSFTPRAQVDGTCRVDGRKVIVTGGDFTVRGGSGGGGGGLGTELAANERALEWKLPLVRLLDAAGGSVRSFEELGRTYLPDGNVWGTIDAQLLNEVPVVSAVLGSVAGLPAVNACLAHWNVMVRDTSQLFPGGPPVVKAALGYDITKEDLGGADVHGRVSGVIDNVADSEPEAIALIRRFLSYMPSSVHELPPRAAPGEPAGEPSELRTLMPANRRKSFDARRLLQLVVDDGSLFEIAPGYGRSRIVALARIDGVPVGVMANNPIHLGGSTDASAGQKVVRFLQLCDVFHLPVLSFADEPGFLVGLESERQGIERAGARLLVTLCRTRMPLMTVVVGRLYGVAGQCHHRPTGMFRRYAWPSARWGSMHIAGGAAAAYRREIESAADPEAMRRDIEARLQSIASPFRTAEATGQDIIDPAETRQCAVEFVHDARRVLELQVGPPPVPFVP